MYLVRPARSARLARPPSSTHQTDEALYLTAVPSHPSLSEVFTALEQAVTSFQSTHPDNDDFARTSTYKRFFPLLRSATPPVWPAVQQVLHAQFGETSASCRAGVEAGEMGVGLVVDVLARTEVGEDSSAAMAAKLWLVQLESAVTKAEYALRHRTVSSDR